MDKYVKKIIRDELINTTLTERAAVSFVAALWSGVNVRNRITQVIFSQETEVEVWSELENSVLCLAKSLALPVTLKIRLRNLVQLIGHQIFFWISAVRPSFTTSNMYNPTMCEVNFVWSERGTLDYIKTAKHIIDLNQENKHLCICLAAVFCVEETLSKPEARVFLQILIDELIPNRILGDTLQLKYRELTTSVNDPAIECFPLFGCYFAKCMKCVPVFKYYFEKMMPEKKEKILENFDIIYGIPKCGDGFLFLISLLTASEFKKFVAKNALKNLTCLLDWPHQKLFMPLAKLLWCCLTKSDYETLFFEIAQLVSKFHMSDVYKNLIEEFWQSSPAAFKEYLMNKRDHSYIINKLLDMENVDNIIKMVINEYPAESRD